MMILLCADGDASAIELLEERCRVLLNKALCSLRLRQNQECVDCCTEVRAKNEGGLINDSADRLKRRYGCMGGRVSDREGIGTDRNG